MPGSSNSPRLTLAVLATVVAAFSMLQSLVSPALPVIQRDLGTTASTVTWVFTALLLSVSVATPLLGRIGDMVGKERTLLIALAALAVGCLLAAIAPNIGVLIGARVVQGLGGAVFPLAFGIIRDEFPSERVHPVPRQLPIVPGPRLQHLPLQEYDARRTQNAQVTGPRGMPRVGRVHAWEDDHRRTGHPLAEHGQRLVVTDPQRQLGDRVSTGRRRNKQIDRRMWPRLIGPPGLRSHR